MCDQHGCHGQQQLKIMRDSDLLPLFGRRRTTYLVCPLIAEGYTRLHKQSQIIKLTSLVACGGSLGCTLDAPPHISQSPPGASAYLTAVVITGSTRGCRNYGVYAAGATGLWSGWWSWYQWYYYFGGAGGHTTKAHMWFYRGYSSAYNSAVNYQLWPIQLAELESKVAEHGEKKKVRRNTF